MALNIFDLFASLSIDASDFTRGLEQARTQAENFSGRLSSIMSRTISTVSRITTLGLGAAATGIGVIVKQATSAYGEYEQLVGGAETLFGDSANTIIEHAQNAYKTAQISANDYLQTVTSFSASLISSISDATAKLSDEEIEQRQNALDEQYEMQADYYDDVYDKQKETYDKQYSLLKEQVDEEVEAVQKANSQRLKELQDAHDKEIEDFEKLTDSKIALINEEYTESIKLIDKEEYDRIKSIDAQIDKINEQANAEKKAIEQEKQARKIANLQYQAENAKTASKRKAAQEELTQYLAELDQKEKDEKRKAQLDDLKNQKDAIKEEAKTKREAAKEEKDTRVSAVKESRKAELNALKKAQQEEEETLKEQNAKELKIFKEAKDEELDALKDSNKKKLSELKKHNKKALKELQASIKEQKKALESGIDESVATSVDMQAVYAQAAELADIAIVDMADNANKMGTAMGSIQDAYNGFAKGNYTMLDNLKLGFGGTKTEMERLIEKAAKLDTSVKKNDLSFANVVKAIHAVQKDIYISGISMEEYTQIVESGAMSQEDAYKLLGTSAKEAATTLQGSLAMARAAWDNLLSGMADPNADFGKLMDNLLESGTAALNNVLPIVERIAQSIGLFVVNVAPIIAQHLPELVEKLLPDILTAASDLLVELAAKLPELFPIVIKTVLQLFEQITQKISNQFPVLQPIFNLLKSALSLIAKVGESAVAALQSLWDKFLQYIVGFVWTIFSDFLTVLADVLDRIAQNSAAVATLNTVLILVLSITTAVRSFSTVMAVVNTVMTAVGTAINAVNAAGGVLKALSEAISAIWAANPIAIVIVALAALVVAIIEVITYWDYLALIWNTFCEEWVAGIQAIGRIFTEVWNNMFSTYQWLISQIIDGATIIISQFTEIISYFVQSWKNGFENIWQYITNLWNSVVSIAQNVGVTVGDAIVGTIKSAINGALWIIEGALNLIPNAINGAIDTINKLPGVSISTIPSITLPRLEKGGVLKKGQVGYLEGNGDEAVVPLSQNTEWIEKVANQLSEKTGNNATYNFYFNIDSVSGNREDMEENADLLMQIFTEKMARKGVVFA